MTHRAAKPARFLFGALLVVTLASLSGCYGYGRYSVYGDQYGYYPYDYYTYGFYPYGFYPYAFIGSHRHFHGHRDHDRHGGATRHNWNGDRWQSRASTGGSRGSGTRGTGLVGSRSGSDGRQSTGAQGGRGVWGSSRSGRSSGGGRF
jgi:hypothetical protein